MAVPILATKLYVPPPRLKVVPRPSLVDRLNEGLAKGGKLTLISAPAGFGKTTLVSEWINGCGRPLAWLSLDDGDEDPARFISYLISALQTIQAGFGKGLLAVLQSPQVSVIESVLISLLNEATSLPDNFILVIDDYHLVESKQVDEAIAFLVEHQPQQMHLVIATREDPPLPLARLRARNQLTEVRAADLRFSEAEATEFLNQVMGLHISVEEVAALEKRTEGWVAGLQLAALSMQGKTDTSEFIRSFSGANQFVLDYLLEEVLNKQPEPVQGFLLQTSILNRLTSSLCDALNESISAQETLEQLERANLFVIPLDNERKWYRYHHLFRDLLRQRLAQRYSKEEITAMHICASEWFERNGDIGEAFHHAISAADFSRAARLLEASWLGMDETFQIGIWLGWVKQLPLSVRRVRPVLCTQIGWAYMDMGNPEASESSLKDAEACLEHPLEELIIVEAEQFRTLPARIAIARAYNASVQGRFTDTIRYAETALDMIPEDQPFIQAQAASILSTSNWAAGELETANVYMSGFVDASLNAGNIVFAVASSFGKAGILVTQGRLRAAIQVYVSALDLASTHGAEGFTAQHHLGLGLLHHEMGEDEFAAPHIQKSFEIGRQTTIVDWAYNKCLAQAHLKEFDGDYDAALDLLDEAQRVYIRTPIPDLRPASARKARIYLKQNHLGKAHAWANKSGLSLHDEPDYLHEFERLTLAKIILADSPNKQQILDVLKMLDAQLELAQKQSRLRSQIEILTLQAFAHQTTGENTQAISALEQALKLAEPEGYFRLFVGEGKPMAELLSNVKSGYLQTYTKRILAQLTPQNNVQPSAFNLQPLIDPLSERELEVLRLIAQGLSNQEITQKLVVALSTVKGHNLRIFAKLQAKSRTEAVARARELGLL